MEALGRFVIIKKIAGEKKMMAGLEITEHQDKNARYVKGEVISFGVDVKGISVGDVVSYDKRAAHEVQEGEEVYQVMLSEAIAFIL